LLRYSPADGNRDPSGWPKIGEMGINNNGQVVGSTDSDAFVWQNGHMTALPVGCQKSAQARGGERWTTA
jgi:probable HAF family extracellular repeat protein